MSYYTLIRQHEHDDRKRFTHYWPTYGYCVHCSVPDTEESAVPGRAYNYSTKSTNPYSIAAVSLRQAIGRRAVQKKFDTHNITINAAKKEKMAKYKPAAGRRTKNRNSKGRRLYLGGEMDVHEAKMANWESDCIMYEDDVWVEDGNYGGERTGWNDGEPAIGCYDACYEQLGDDVIEATDEELRAMGLLYDSEEEEYEHDTPSSTNEVLTALSTPLVMPRTPMSEAADLDELWIVVEDRRLPVDERGEWDIVSEF